MIYKLSFFLEIESSLKTSIQGFFLIAAFFWASYKFWVESASNKEFNNQDELIITHIDSNMINSEWKGGMPANPGIYVDFDVTNTNKDKFIMKNINRSDSKVLSDLEINRSHKYLNVINPTLSNRMENIYLPFDIPGRDHKIIRLEYSCKFKEYTDKILKSFINYETYEIEFEFVYSNIEKKNFSKTINIEIINNSFKEGMIERLKSLNRTDLFNN